ncbi:hypothetical protein NC652_029270 [Populus alba x Populus x berolinensis]|nr:hypothetical protein NC652_029270 [Populus alba x Populus x berolinensis]
MNGDGSGIILLRPRCLAPMQWRVECQLFQTTSETENQIFNAQQDESPRFEGTCILLVALTLYNELTISGQQMVSNLEDLNCPAESSICAFAPKSKLAS